MSFFDTRDARPLGSGMHSPAGSVTDPELATAVARYKRNTAGRYRPIAPDEIGTLYQQRMLVSPKIDGETWFLVLRGGEAALVNPRGRVLSGALPVLDEARRVAARISPESACFVGELFALRRGGRPRHGDLAAALSAAELERVGFTAFDVLALGEPDDGSLEGYERRMATVAALLDGGKRLQAVATEQVEGPDGVEQLYTEWVASQKAEGLVVRAEGRIYKVKPVLHVDAVVLGYTTRTDDDAQIRSCLLGLVREAGAEGAGPRLQVLGSCGNLGSDDDRRALAARLAPIRCESAYRHASSDGALYQFVRPELVLEIRVNDLQSEGTDGELVPRMVLSVGPDGYEAVQRLPGVSLIGPILSRVRDDKRADATDAGIGQIIDRVLPPELETRAAAVDLPVSQVIRREVFVKPGKDQMAVRKLLVWKTNKEEVDPRYPAFVVHWTDYSPGRKEPLQRTVRLAPDADAAHALGDELALEGVKRGWERVT